MMPKRLGRLGFFKRIKSDGRPPQERSSQVPPNPTLGIQPPGTEKPREDSVHRERPPNPSSTRSASSSRRAGPTLQPSASTIGGDQVHETWRLSPHEAASAAPDVPNPHLVRHGAELLSNYVKCDVLLFYSGRQYDDLRDQIVEWFDSSYYRKLNDRAIPILRDHNAPPEQQLYRKSGLCRLIRDDSSDVVDSKIVDDENQWSEVLRYLITTFYSKCPDIPFHLEVRWVYSDLTIQRIDGERYATTVGRVIMRKLKANWEGHEFIPRQDLDEIFGESTIHQLITRDQSIRDSATSLGTEFDREGFIATVSRDATRLLALCIYVKLPLVCLFHLVQAGKRDVDIPLDLEDCPHETFEREFRDLRKWQGGFQAHFFLNDGPRPQHRHIKKEIVVPIHFDTNKDHLGEGGFGQVYKVTIDPDHHRFTPDRQRVFALKIFKEIGSKTERGFENERHTLSTITKVPHDNITAHLASWTQSDKFYMLFPCAEMNLRQLWRTWPRPELHNNVVGWLLSQFKGLADGVRHIHNLGPANLSPQSLGKNLLPSESSRTGFHHDLKPENILVFTKVSELNREPSLSDFILKISDFGTAKINTVLSGADHTHYTSNLSFGDSVYGAPDFALEGRTSRPYDIWSLGCIFLEMMLWTFDVSGSDLGIFAQSRLECIGAQPHQSGAFWHRDRDNKIRLKEPVLERLGQLEEHCRPQGVFRNIVSATGRMLHKDPKQRIKAPALCNLLDAALLQASFDLEIEGYYMKNAKVPLYAAAPTLVSEETPGRHSIDDRSIYAPEDGYLQVLESDHHVHSPPLVGRQSDESMPNQVRLAPINTHSSNTTLPSSPTSPRHKRTPSITLSDHNNPFTSRVILDANTEEGSEQPPMGESPIGAHKVLVGRGDVSDVGYRIHRHPSSSVDSQK